MVGPEFWQSVLVGFAAQLVDGALGMAYGVCATSFLMSFGFPPATASAMTHTSEMFTTAASAVSHTLKRNVDWNLCLRLGLAGVVGGVAGAFVVSWFPGDVVKPFVWAYLLIMGFVLLVAAIRGLRERPPHVEGAIPLGLVGGFLDASGGGGWGPVVASTLLGRGHAPRTTIGSVNTAEFLVTVAISGAFFVAMGGVRLQEVAGLILGGVVAAPLAAHVVRVAPARILMFVVAFLIIFLAVSNLRKPVEQVLREGPASLFQVEKK